MERPPVPCVVCQPFVVSSVPQHCASTYIATGEVATLEHKVGDDTVETRAGVALLGIRLGAEGTEVLGRLGDRLIEELEVDAAALLCEWGGDASAKSIGYWRGWRGGAEQDGGAGAARWGR
jgi:hypothetical protein